MNNNYLLILLFLLSLNKIYSQNEWEEIKSLNGIEVYFRNVENSDLIEIKTSTTLETDIETVLCIITDFENFPVWSYGTLDAYKISSVTNSEYIYYLRSDLPWPVKDRDCVLRYRLSKLSENKVTTMSYCLNGYVDERTDCSRIYDLTGSWTIEKIDNSNVEITYYLKLNPGEGIPDWIIKMAADVAPFETLTNLREEVKKEKFKNCDYELN